MANYVVLTHWTGEGAVHADKAPERVEQAREMARAMGAEIKAFYMLMGRYDTMVLMEAPDDATMAKFALSLARKGSVRTETMPAFTEDEFKKLIASLP
jgi:uncharacterized protein with GYD domain